ncbi:MAG: hypothetical protein MRY83_23830 [Flavobacteriales bacterium]|nr:hypothetical protein [Flavobacteriales bacterium]
MRKSEMNEDQLNFRVVIVELMKNHGWVDLTENNWFDEDLWADREICMELSMKNSKLLFEFSFEDGITDLSVEKDVYEGVGIYFKDTDPHALAEYLVKHSEDFGLSNYKKGINKLIAHFPEAYYFDEDRKLEYKLKPFEE